MLDKFCGGGLFNNHVSTMKQVCAKHFLIMANQLGFGNKGNVAVKTLLEGQFAGKCEQISGYPGEATVTPQIAWRVFNQGNKHKATLNFEADQALNDAWFLLQGQFPDRIFSSLGCPIEIPTGQILDFIGLRFVDFGRMSLSGSSVQNGVCECVNVNINHLLGGLSANVWRSKVKNAREKLGCWQLKKEKPRGHRGFPFQIQAASSFAKNSLTQSVVTDFGRSSGKPSARAQHCAANTPRARLTPKSTV